MTEWTMTYKGFDPSQEGLREALCTLGNGYFATRGAAAEAFADDVHYPGTYVAGLYNRLDTEVSGRVIENEDLVNVSNWVPLRFRIEGSDEWMHPATATLEEYEQELDVRRGVLTRTFAWVDPEGRRTRVAQRRFVSMRDPHVAGQQTTFLPENWSGRLEVQSALDGTVVNGGVPRYRSLNSRHLNPLHIATVGDDGMSVLVETNQSRVAVAVAARTQVFDDRTILRPPRTTSEQASWIDQRLTLDLSESQGVTVEKMVVLYTSRDRAISDPWIEACDRLAELPRFGEELERHVLSWDHLWHRFELATNAEAETKRILNLHIFHLLQTVSKHTIDLDVGVPARGWHGEAYRGHIFWDELFIFPFLTLHLPDLTRSLLQYRYRRLPEAQRAAARAGYAGAMYPWQSGSNGREETQIVHLNPRSGNWLPDNSHRQRHINIAIAYNVWKYYEATADVEFMAFYGAEMLVQIARFWSSLATYNKALDKYEICGVMGPDEYHDGYPDADEPAGLDNNAYTNLMVVWLLGRARLALDLVPEFRRRELWEKLEVTRRELERWEDIAHKMFVPFHDDGIISQFQGYEDLAEFPWADYIERYGDIQRLDRILEAEGDTPNRYKASKQADVLMLFYLLSADELEELLTRLGYGWEPDWIARNIEYYLARTSHGSTLSRVVHAWVLARSDRERSWSFFVDALRSDVFDIQGGTTAEGIHLGAMAGTVDLVQRCFTGLDTRNGVLRLDPAIPAELEQLRFAVQYRGAFLHCEMTAGEVQVSMPVTSHDPISVAVGDAEFELASGTQESVALD